MYKNSYKIRCPICMKSDYFIIQKGIWSDTNKNAYRCNICDIAFINPMLSDEEERLLYENYNNHLMSRGVLSEKNTEELHIKSRKVAEERWKVVSKYFKNNMKVLEIGSATGAFLEICSEKCECVCVEPNKNNRLFSSKHSVKQYSNLEKVPQNRKFDIVCLFHVFEHFRDPYKFLNKIICYLKKDGLVIIEVPYIEDPLLSIYDIREFKAFYFQPMHPIVYSLKALKSIFKDSGFEEIGYNFYQRYGLGNHLSWLKNKSPGGDSQLEKFFGELTKYRAILEKKGKTDTLFYIARCKNEKYR